MQNQDLAQPTLAFLKRLGRAAVRNQLAVEFAIVLALFYFPPLYSAVIAFFRTYTLPVAPGKEISRMAEFFGMTTLLAYFVWSGNEPFSKFGVVKFKLSDISWGIVIFGANYLLAFLFKPIILALDHVPGARTSFAVHGDLPLWEAPLVFLAGALFEEALWRSYSFNRLKDLGLKPWPAILISSALFSSYHIYQGWNSLPIMFATGVIFGFYFYKSGVVAARHWPRRL
ncbi:MAG TPA: CPBP family intramembrane glutamic endopeptidase [Fimbriimonadaceae bacterium]|jgi:membrane protease YdiL (CAAX protease family)